MLSYETIDSPFGIFTLVRLDKVAPDRTKPIGLVDLPEATLNVIGMHTANDVPMYFKMGFMPPPPKNLEHAAKYIADGFRLAIKEPNFARGIETFVLSPEQEKPGYLETFFMNFFYPHMISNDPPRSKMMPQAVSVRGKEPRPPLLELVLPGRCNLRTFETVGPKHERGAHPERRFNGSLKLFDKPLLFRVEHKCIPIAEFMPAARIRKEIINQLDNDFPGMVEHDLISDIVVQEPNYKE